jgi:hypothetical protein
VEAIVDFACNLVIVVSLVYFGIGLILELVERWKRLDPALLKSKAAPVQIPLALPESCNRVNRRKQERDPGG